MAIFGPGKTLLQRIHEKEVELAMAEARKYFYQELIRRPMEGGLVMDLINSAESACVLAARLSAELKHLKEEKDA